MRLTHSLLILTMLLITLLGNSLTSVNAYNLTTYLDTKATLIKPVVTCPQKAAQQLLQKSCQQIKSQFIGMISAIVSLIRPLSDKSGFFFLLIISLFHPVYSIFKPPRCRFV